MSDDWAQARMWAWERLEGWGHLEADGERKNLGFTERVQFGEKLAQWVMSGPHPVEPEPDTSEAAAPGFVSCRCPAGAGEDCPLTIPECRARTVPPGWATLENVR